MRSLLASILAMLITLACVIPARAQATPTPEERDTALRNLIIDPRLLAATPERYQGQRIVLTGRIIETMPTTEGMQLVWLAALVPGGGSRGQQAVFVGLDPSIGTPVLRGECYRFIAQGIGTLDDPLLGRTPTVVAEGWSVLRTSNRAANTLITGGYAGWCEAGPGPGAVRAPELPGSSQP